MEAARQGHHPNESRQGAEAPAAEWYYRHDGQEKGPVPLSSLRDLAGAGQLAPADPVRRAGTDRWHPAGELADVFPGGRDTTTTTPPTPASSG